VALIAAAALWAVSLAGVGGLFEQFVRAAGVLLSGMFVVATLISPRSVFQRASMAAAGAGAAALVWSRHFGIDWLDIQHAAAQEISTAYQAMAARSPSGSGTADLFQQVAETADKVAALYPALLVLGALAGLVLAWRLYHEVATHPLGEAPRPFAAFRFGDQFVWVPVLALAALVLPVTDAIGELSIRLLAENVLLVCLALYMARGLAVFCTLGRHAPRIILGVLSIVACVLFPFAASGLALLGLADSWVDFRRRMAPPPTGGLNR
jgi:predicted membrane protein DUF2232